MRRALCCSPSGQALSWLDDAGCAWGRRKSSFTRRPLAFEPLLASYNPVPGNFLVKSGILIVALRSTRTSIATHSMRRSTSQLRPIRRRSKPPAIPATQPAAPMPPIRRSLTGGASPKLCSFRSQSKSATASSSVDLPGRTTTGCPGSPLGPPHREAIAIN